MRLQGHQKCLRYIEVTSKIGVPMSMDTYDISDETFVELLFDLKVLSKQ